jgi:ABC-2 type transport system permease protein
MICYCLDYLFSLLCVLTNSVWGVSSLREGIIQILSGAIIPLYLLPPLSYQIISILPFAYMIDTPVKILTTTGHYTQAVLIQIFYCLLMLFCASYADTRFTKKLQIQGG